METRNINYLSSGPISAAQMAILKDAKAEVYDGLVKLVRITEDYVDEGDWILLIGIDYNPFCGWYVSLPSEFGEWEARSVLDTILNDNPEFRARAAEVEWGFV